MQNHGRPVYLKSTGNNDVGSLLTGAQTEDAVIYTMSREATRQLVR